MKFSDMKFDIKVGHKHIPMSAIGVIGCVMLALIGVMALRVDKAKSGYYEARRQLDHYREEVWQLDRLNEPAANAELKEELARFASGNNVAAHIEQITSTGKRFNVQFDSISPRAKTGLSESEKKSLPNLSRIPIDMTIRGGYQDVALFLSQLGKLDQAVMRVDEFRLSPPNPESDSLRGPLTVSVFIPENDEKPIYMDQGQLSVELRKAGKTRFREFGRNPFKTWTESAPHEDLVLEGIMFDASDPVVLINGKIWRPGDQVGHVKIVEIKPTSIVIEKDGKREIVRLRTG